MPKLTKKSVDYYSFYCEGCEHLHTYTVTEDGQNWIFNGDMDKPSFTPSLLNRNPLIAVDGTVTERDRCHLHVTDGMVIHCSDCTHKLAGLTVELKEKING